MLKQGYRGSRYSFGYPACPNLANQKQLLALLGAERIGIQMGDEDQLHPEQSTSAIKSGIGVGVDFLRRGPAPSRAVDISDRLPSPAGKVF